MGLSAQVQAVLRERQLRKKRVSRKYVGAAQKDRLGMHENCAGISHPQVVGNHDTIWHSTSHHTNFHTGEQTVIVWMALSRGFCSIAGGDRLTL